MLLIQRENIFAICKPLQANFIQYSDNKMLVEICQCLCQISIEYHTNVNKKSKFDYEEVD